MSADSPAVVVGVGVLMSVGYAGPSIAGAKPAQDRTTMAVVNWIQDHQAILWTLGAASVVMFIGSLLLMPAIAIRIRADYFSHEHRPPSRWVDHHPVLRVVMLIAKNMLGGILLVAGVAMLVLPGQGLLTILIGFLLIDFPGKYRFERWLVMLGPIRRPINWLRRRADRPPLVAYEPPVEDRAASTTDGR